MTWIEEEEEDFSAWRVAFDVVSMLLVIMIVFALIMFAGFIVIGAVFEL